MKRILKSIYRIIPFKRALFSLLRVFWRPPKAVFQHLHFQGTFTVPIQAGSSFKLYHPGFQIENEIFWNGLTNGWERESINLWIKLCRDANTVIDIGANTGIYALTANAVNPSASVYAFEPHPLFFGLMQKNIAINAFTIKAYDKAVSDVDGIITIEDYSGQSKTIQIDAITLDTFLSTNDISTVDVIKIDVEHHEPQVLAGFVQHLGKLKPTLIIEILTPVVATAVSQAVAGLGYLYFNIDEKSGIRQTATVEVSDHFNYLICQPAVASKLGLISA